MNSTEFDLWNEVSESYVETNGIRLHTVQIGRGEPLILLHGFPDFWYAWKHVIMELKDHFRLIIPDQRGYNLSDKPKGVENYEIPLLIADIIGLSDALGIDKFYLAGHDWGGVLAYCIASRHPSRVKKLAVLNGPHLKIFQDKLQNDPMQKKASWYIHKFLEPGDPKSLSDAFIAQMKAGMEASDNPDKDKYMEFWTRPGGIIGGINYYKANIAGFTEWSGEIKVPTLVIHGMKDTAILPSCLEELDKFIEDLLIMRMLESGHSPLKEQPKLTADHLLDFFN